MPVKPIVSFQKNMDKYKLDKFLRKITPFEKSLLTPSFLDNLILMPDESYANFMVK